MRKIIIIFILCLFSQGSLQARESAVGLSKSEISVDIFFDGEEILLFGSMTQADEVLIKVKGPSKDLILRPYEKYMGIWFEGEKIPIGKFPVFYNLSSSDRMLDKEGEELTQKVIISEFFRDAETENTYGEIVTNFNNDIWRQDKDNNVKLYSDSLFSYRLSLPADIQMGDYSVEFLLLENGDIVDTHNSFFTVKRSSFLAYTYDISKSYPLIYGLFAVFLSFLVGWFSSLLLRRV